ncbi:acyl carrier protein [Mycoplasma struthionis]|uniref:Acyl carrier protein n=1 Tax=Mycoplasma struthionis TaxID=538220 RepID=A0A3G8LIT7_9MOLU|nr:acyl carrier protein [Mycoplasma struthionis]AZG68802.1 acyl carrier protein [Mycoplasma struthionis]TPI01575.1 acyl carrier protein [Mycoplasma struthionis]
MNAKDIIFSEIKKLTKVKFDMDSDIKTLNIDSLDLVILVSDIESKYKISVTDEELLSIKFVGDIVKIFEQKFNK